MMCNITPPIHTAKSTAFTLALMLTLLLLLTGCRKDVCYDHDEHSFGYRLAVQVQWEREWERPYGCDWQTDWTAVGLGGTTYDDLRPTEPEGVAVVLYDEQDGQPVYRRETHLPATGGHVTVDETTRTMLFYNDDTECIVFSDMNALAQARATTMARSRAAFAALHDGEPTVGPPDMLYAHYTADYRPERVEGWAPTSVTMRPLVYTYIVRCPIAQGAQYVAEARGALAGMAASVRLSDGSTGDDCATLLYDCTLQGDGVVEARVMSFGVPGFSDGYYSRTAGGQHRYDLGLELLLKNGRTLSFAFDVTDQMERQPRGGVIAVGGVSVSDEDGQGSGGGFNASVEGWGDVTDVDLGTFY